MNKIIIVICFMLLSLSSVQAQRLCEALVDNALEQAGQNCTEQNGEISCYAYDSLRSTFFSEMQPTAFVAPGSVVDLPTVHTIQSASLDLEEDEWGIAYLQAKASLTEATADSAVRIIMLGDVFMENAVEGSASNSESVATLYITIADVTVLRDSPADSGAPVGDGTSAMVLEADAITSDGTWVRADFSGQDVWVSRVALFPNDAIDNLPTADAGASTQPTANGTTAFSNLYFTTGSNSECQEAPDMLIVQGPTDQSADITINDVPIRIGSTIALGMGSKDGNDVMWVAVMSGKATLYPDTPQALEIPEGYITEAFISPPVGANVTAILDKVTGVPIMSASGAPYVRRVPTTLFNVPEPLTENGVAHKNTNFYKTVKRLPENLLNYSLDDGTAKVTETICTLTPVQGMGSVNGHIGPGRNRSIRTIYEETEVITDAAEVTAEDGSLWYEIETESFGLVYLAAEDFTQSCEQETRTVRTTCLLEVSPDTAELWGHVGPGYHRNVTNYLDTTLSYVPTGRVDVEDVPWFEVAYSDTVNVWVDGSNFVSVEGCSLDDLAATPPPILVPVAAHTATPAPLPTSLSGVVATQAPSEAPAVVGEEPASSATEEVSASSSETEEASAPSQTEEPNIVNISGSCIIEEDNSGWGGVQFSANWNPAVPNQSSIVVEYGGTIFLMCDSDSDAPSGETQYECNELYNSIASSGVGSEAVAQVVPANGEDMDGVDYAQFYLTGNDGGSTNTITCSK